MTANEHKYVRGPGGELVCLNDVDPGPGPTAAAMRGWIKEYRAERDALPPGSPSRVQYDKWIANIQRRIEEAGP